MLLSVVALLIIYTVYRKKGFWA